MSIQQQQQQKKCNLEISIHPTEMCEMSSRDLAPQRVVSKITYNVIKLTKAYHGSLLTHTYTYMHTYTRARAPTHMHTRIHTHTYVHINIHIHTHKHTHKHTHTYIHAYILLNEQFMLVVNLSHM